MTIPPTARLAALCALFATAPAFAQKVAPGLWENQMQMSSASGQMEKQMAQAREQMAKLPPDQRKMMEEMMARQGIGMAGGDMRTMRSCISKEQAEKGDIPDPDGRCKREMFDRSASGFKFRFSCSGDPPTKGSGEFKLDGDKAYSGQTTIDTTVQGRPEQIRMQTRGRWISADCGQLKPRP